MTWPLALDYQTLAFSAGPDLPTLLGTLAAIDGMAPEPDEAGNPQAVYWLDTTPGTPDGYQLTFPAAVDADAVQTAVDGCPTETQVAAAAAAEETAAGWVQLRMIRDRWLAQTDYVESFLGDPTSFQHLPQPIKDAITANADGWVVWRQQMRDLPDLPGTPSLDPVAAVAAVAGIHSTGDSFPAPWPQPPDAPIIHLT